MRNTTQEPPALDLQEEQRELWRALHALQRRVAELELREPDHPRVAEVWHENV